MYSYILWRRNTHLLPVYIYKTHFTPGSLNMLVYVSSSHFMLVYIWSSQYICTTLQSCRWIIKVLPRDHSSDCVSLYHWLSTSFDFFALDCPSVPALDFLFCVFSPFIFLVCNLSKFCFCMWIFPSLDPKASWDTFFFFFGWMDKKNNQHL